MHCSVEAAVLEQVARTAAPAAVAPESAAASAAVAFGGLVAHVLLPLDATRRVVGLVPTVWEKMWCSDGGDAQVGEVV